MIYRSPNIDEIPEILEMKHRVMHMYNQLDNLAGSNSKSKINLTDSSNVYSTLYWEHYSGHGNNGMLNAQDLIISNSIPNYL